MILLNRVVNSIWNTNLKMFDLVIENQRERSIRFKAIFYCRKEHYRNNLDLISFSRIESYISDALHKEKVILSKRHNNRLKRDFLWNMYQPSVNHSSNNLNTNQVHDEIHNLKTNIKIKTKRKYQENLLNVTVVIQPKAKSLKLKTCLWTS